MIDDQEDEGFEANDTDDTVVPAEAVSLAPALLEHLPGTETGVARTAKIEVVVSMVNERPGNAG